MGLCKGTRVSEQAAGSARSSGWGEKQQLEGFDPAVMCPCSRQPEQGHGPGYSPGQPWDFGLWAEQQTWPGKKRQTE